LIVADEPNEPSWDEIFDPSGATSTPAKPTPVGPATRREIREREVQGAPPPNPPKKKRRRRLLLLWILLIVVGLVAAAGATGWVLFEDRIRAVLGWEEPDDYIGSGNGTEVDVTIVSGQIGEDVAQTLTDVGVTKTFDAFYDLLLSLDEQPVFVPGTYVLQEEMSAESALDALLDEDNRQVNSVAIREGLTIPAYVELLSAGTGMPTAEFEAALVDPASYGIPAEAPNFEGYLFPANYQFDPGVTARDIIQTLVDRTFESLDSAGVPVADRHRVLTLASLIQREARLPDDFYKVSRVIQNRLTEGMRLEFDSTAHYGAGGASGSVFTTDEERAAVNDYNTYVIPGLPIGPIAGAGDQAIDAAMHPVDGPWLFFVTVNLDTGETVFTTTISEHEAAVEQLRQWCRDSDSASCG
jgi:UPF0755 protein